MQVCYLGVQSIAMSVSVFLSLWLSVCPPAHLKNNTFKLRDVFCTCKLWPLQCSALCTSGFADDVTFSHNGQYDAWRCQYGDKQAIKISNVFAVWLCRHIRCQQTAHRGRSVICLRSYLVFICTEVMLFLMDALCNRAGHYILALWFYLFSIFFPRPISAAADWMSTILPHMVWP